MKTFFTFCFVLISSLAFSQARVVFNGDVGLKFEGGSLANPVYLVLDNPSSNAIVDAGPVGGPAIWSEDEYHIVKWNVKTSTGNYNVPFISPSPTIPPTYVATFLTIATPGSADGYVEFSTYRHDNSLATIPSDVTHMNYDLTGLVGGQFDAINRFWIIDTDSYTTKPGMDVAFGYDVLELDGGMIDPNLLIQRFNPIALKWHDYMPSTTITSPLATGVVLDAEFYRSWTLSNSTNPLPIELLSFVSECKGSEGVNLKWSTAAEINNAYFTLERSEDGIFWETFADNIHGSGNSSSIINYSYVDNNPFRGLTYYRLSQTDFDGASERFTPIVSDCDGVGFEIINAFSDSDGNVQMVVSAGHDEAFNVEILDMNGKLAAAQQNVMLLEGLNYFNIDRNHLGYGMYVIKLQSNTELMTRKLLLN